MNEYVKLGIWVAVVAVVFAFLWRKGYLLRMGNYIGETREELKKCSWPSRSELKGSTAVVMVTVVILGFFTMVVDFVFSRIIVFLTS